MKKSISEVLKLVSEQPNKQSKIDTLRENYSPVLAQILQCALDPRVKWLLPEGTPPFKENVYPGQETVLFSEARRLYLFLEGGNPNLSNLRRETLFIQLLEMLHPDDAKVILAAKDKKVPYKGITVKLVNEAFPGLIMEDDNGKDQT